MLNELWGLVRLLNVDLDRAPHSRVTGVAAVLHVKLCHVFPKKRHKKQEHLDGNTYSRRKVLGVLSTVTDGMAWNYCIFT